MTTRQWITLMAGLWACFFVAQFVLDGWPRIIVGLCVTLGFAWSSVERWRNWRRSTADAEKRAVITRGGQP